MKEQTTETHKPAASPLTGARKRLSRIASGRGIGFGERIDLIVRIALMAVVAIGCFMVLQPFLTAILLAAVIAVVTWPLFRRLRASLRQSSGAAATLMVLEHVGQPALIDEDRRLAQGPDPGASGRRRHSLCGLVAP